METRFAGLIMAVAMKWHHSMMVSTSLGCITTNFTITLGTLILLRPDLGSIMDMVTSVDQPDSGSIKKEQIAMMWFFHLQSSLSLLLFKPQFQVLLINLLYPIFKTFKVIF